MVVDNIRVIGLTLAVATIGFALTACGQTDVDKKEEVVKAENKSVDKISKKTTKTNEETNKASQQQDVKDNKTSELISKESYNKIVKGDTTTGNGGMSYEEVVDILGKPTTTSKSDKEDMEITVVGWSGDDADVMGNAISVTFINGHAADKSFLDLSVLQ